MAGLVPWHLDKRSENGQIRTLPPCLDPKPSLLIQTSPFNFVEKAVLQNHINYG